MGEHIVTAPQSTGRTLICYFTESWP